MPIYRYTCPFCGKPDQFDPHQVEAVANLRESVGAESAIEYYVVKCNHCGRENQVSPPRKSKP